MGFETAKGCVSGSGEGSRRSARTPGLALCSNAPWGGTSTLALLVTLLLVGESLVWGSPGSLLVVVIIFVVEGCVSAEGGLSSLCKAQPSLQVIYLPLHGSFVVSFLGHVTTRAGVASAGLRGIHAPFPKPSVFLVPAMLRVWEITLLLGSGWLRLMGACSMGV